MILELNNRGELKPGMLTDTKTAGTMMFQYLKPLAEKLGLDYLDMKKHRGKWKLYKGRYFINYDDRVTTATDLNGINQATTKILWHE